MFTNSNTRQRPRILGTKKLILPLIFEVLFLILLIAITLSNNGSILVYSLWIIVNACTIAFLWFQPRLPVVIRILLLFIVPFVSFYCLEAFTHNPWEMEWISQIVNYFILLFFTLIVFCIQGSSAFATSLTLSLTMIIGIANYFVCNFRANPILPWDFASFQTAMSVAGNYSYRIDARFFFAVLAGLFTLGIAISNTVHLKFTKKFIISRVVIALLSASMLVGIKSVLWNAELTEELLPHTDLFSQWYAYVRNGFVLNFIENLQYLEIDEPDGYNASQLAENMEEYTSEQEDSSSDDTTTTTASSKPNIIVIMNESFSDLSVLHSFNTNEDYMPFIHSLQTSDNAITGQMFSSVCGGNTANTEFEFLTNNTMGFLPSGSVAYQQYISGSIPTFVTSLKQQGYRTIGMHPYNSNGWNRSAIYPYLGFDETYFRDDFTNAQIFREYVSDASSYQKIIELYETKESDENLFIFEVTMQNHGGYSTIYDNFPLTISLTDIQGHEATENYLSLVKESDQALNDLVNYFQGVEEDTIIMMFGDHQPNDYVATCIANLTGTASEDRSLEELQNRYIVPFVLWANFDIPAEHNITTSANYLNLLLTQLTDIENTPYQDYLSTLQTQLPVITANVCIDTNGNYYTVSEAKQNEQFKSGLNLYEQAQYEYLFDSKHRDDSLFGN